METKLFIHPTYVLQYRGRRLALSDRHGLIMSRLMTAQARNVLKSSIVNTVYQEEVKTVGKSDFNLLDLKTEIGKLGAMLEGWPLSIEEDAGMFYRVIERRSKHKAPGGI